jgi:hypothetical protein
MAKSVNVYLPAPLASRLEPFQDRLKISEICQRALEEAIELEERAQAGDRISRVIARLSQALTPAQQAKAAGRSAGMEWAEDTAALGELSHVARLRQQASALFARPFSFTSLATGGVSFSWFNSDHDLAGECVLPDTVPQDWLKKTAGTAFFDEYVHGFIEGAGEVHDAVVRELERRKYEEQKAPRADVDDGPF